MSPRQLFGSGVKDNLKRPFMLMNAEGGVNIDPTRKAFYENLKNDAYNLTITGTEHSNFTDSPLLFQQLSTYSPNLAEQLKNVIGPIGTIDAARGAKIIDNYTLAFFNKYLKNQDSPLINGTSSEYPEVQFESRRVTGDDSSDRNPESVDSDRQCRVQ